MPAALWAGQLWGVGVQSVLLTLLLLPGILFHLGADSHLTEHSFALPSCLQAEQGECWPEGRS